MTIDHQTAEQALFALGAHVRYVAFGDGQDVRTAQRDDLRDASEAGSDFFEELLVNPTLLTLARQRGELDCGGLRHIVVGYGSFTQIVLPIGTGHVSVCVERDTDTDRAVREIAAVVERLARSW